MLSTKQHPEGKLEFKDKMRLSGKQLTPALKQKYAARLQTDRAGQEYVILDAFDEEFVGMFDDLDLTGLSNFDYKKLCIRQQQNYLVSQKLNKEP